MILKIGTLGIDVSLQNRYHERSEFDIGLGWTREVKRLGVVAWLSS